jgi:hypothetical protein
VTKRLAWDLAACFAAGAATMLSATAASAQTADQPKDQGSTSLLPPSPFGGQPQQLTPPAPPPWDQPLSTSGVDLAAPATTPAGPQPADARVAALEARIAALEEDRRATSGPKIPEWLTWFHASGFVQSQLLWQIFNAAASPNSTNGILPPGIGANDVTAQSNGNTTNPDFLRLRRARIRLAFEPDPFLNLVFEVEPVPRDPYVPGSGTIAREIEAIVRPWVGGRTRMEIAAGSFKVPFGHETLEYDPDRPFIERSYFQQNILPGDFDLGAHVDFFAAHDHFHAVAAVLNGRTFGELDQGGSLDLNRPKDGVLSVAWDTHPLRLGLSGYGGEGQLVDPQGLRFKQYPRGAFDVDFALRKRFLKAGETRIISELMYGTNMDRGVLIPGALPTIPDDITQPVVNKDELGAILRIEQDIRCACGEPLLTVGLRYDFYSPDLSLDMNGRHTASAVVALHLGHFAQLMLEYDHVIDFIRPSGPIPPEKNIEVLSAVLQGQFGSPHPRSRD